MIIQKYFIFKDLFNNFKNINEKDIKSIVQSIYFNEVEKIGLNNIECPYCKHKGCFKVKGYYKRTFIINGNRTKINIKRVVCDCCNKSHALFFYDFIPYYSLSSIDSSKLIDEDYKDEDELYESELINNLKRRASKFAYRLKELFLKIKDGIETINLKYIPYRFNSYLQIHKGNIFYKVSLGRHPTT